MKFLILTCSTGGGHHSTAAAISEYLTAQGQACVTLDCLDFLPPSKAKLISEGHVLLYRKAPWLFGIGYRFEEEHTPKFIISQCESCAEEFCAAFHRFGCDVVISVHVFAALIVTAARKSGRLTVPSYFVATDYTCSPGVGFCDQDGFFIPHEKLREEFINCGVPENRIMVTGIPVRSGFYSKQSPSAARDRVGLPHGGRVVLMTCGSMGAGPMEELARLLDAHMTPADQLVILCGTNEKLKRDLEKAPLSSRVRIEGFTDQMSDYMDAADLILTKAGGLATTEAVMKRLPIVYIDAIPGCETRNLEFMVQQDCALTAQTREELAILVCTLLQDPDRLNACRNAMAQHFPDQAVKRIYHHLQRLHT